MTALDMRGMTLVGKFLDYTAYQVQLTDTISIIEIYKFGALVDGFSVEDMSINEARITVAAYFEFTIKKGWANDFTELHHIIATAEILSKRRGIEFSEETDGISHWCPYSRVRRSRRGDLNR